MEYRDTLRGLSSRPSGLASTVIHWDRWTDGDHAETCRSLSMMRYRPMSLPSRISYIFYSHSTVVLDNGA
eukprot:36418-Eustigmatos_ZCMA.PRE.1